MKTMKDAQIGIRIEKALVARAEKKAKAEHRTLSQVVRMLLEDWLRKAA